MTDTSTITEGCCFYTYMCFGSILGAMGVIQRIFRKIFFRKIQIVFSKNFKKFEKIRKIILLHNLYLAWKSNHCMESNFGLLLCLKSIKNGQIITDLAKTVHFGKYYFNKFYEIMIFFFEKFRFFFLKKTTSKGYPLYPLHESSSVTDMKDSNIYTWDGGRSFGTSSSLSLSLS
jgi:hypothetical protein